MSIDELFDAFAARWQGAPGATPDEIRAAEQALGVVFPPAYRTLLALSNGGEGPAGHLHLSLWSTEELKRLNDDYAIAWYLPGIVGIGTDGGGVCVALDYRGGTPPTLVRVPLGDLDPASVTTLADSLEAALRGDLRVER